MEKCYLMVTLMQIHMMPLNSNY